MFKRNGVYYCRLIGADGQEIRRRLSQDRGIAEVLLADIRKEQELIKAGLAMMVAKAAKTMEDAKDLPEIIQDDLQQEIEGIGKVKLSVVCEVYLAHLLHIGRADNTLKLYEDTLNRILRGLNCIFVTDLTIGTFEGYLANQHKQGVKGQTLNVYGRIFRGALDYALQQGLIQDNPLVDLSSIRQDEPRFRRDFQPEEARRLLAVIKKDSKEWYLRFLLYFQTGLRATAGLDVNWEWIDLQEKTLRLPLENNKSRRVLNLPISEILLAELRSVWNNLPKDRRQEGKILPSVTYAVLRSKFRGYCEMAGLDTKGLCLHSIRHTVATMIYKACGNVKAVQEILGHANASTTLRYLHVNEEEKRSAIQTLGVAVGS
jgi:integrase/recombinase XerD